jgi:hypothetical protein
MSQPLIEGPGPPESVPSAPEQRVKGLVPFVHVDDVERSIAFYYHLGFIVASVYKYNGTPVWAELRSEGAELMVSTDGDSIDPAGQAVLFYLYSDNLAALPWPSRVRLRRMARKASRWQRSTNSRPLSIRRRRLRISI